jgi:hypothetical protein
VPLRDSAAALARRAAAEQRGEEPPAELRTPSYGHGEALRSARLTDPRAARALHDLLVVLLEEADVHGTGPVHVAFAREDGRLVLRVANRVPAVRRPGLRGSGGPAIGRLASRLPGPGNVGLRGDVDGGFVGLRAEPGWFGVQVSCEAALLSPPPTG